LFEGQIKDQLKLPAEHPSRLPAFEARKIIYPGKGFHVWWVLPQLIKQVKSAILIFQDDSLNINNMNINPGRKLRGTIIPLNNPDPATGEEDTRGKIQ